ncbi:hypothetical protein [Janthinobacterium fluminis]|uniref:Lipoprotein n=1 Tax=Janthinobacterium fluminis TaxID=2987524 RepID=A0ABT5K6G0_9BURK|nr:hypothetical protein [Janthinobacterium fluminis]MDC8760356.1 hypothetical protein [Janthinobacterium fluminis]
MREPSRPPASPARHTLGATFTLPDEAIMVIKTAITLLSATLIAGCAVPHSPAPLATNFATSKQAKLQAVAHWNAISAHIDQQLAPALKNSPAMPLYVEALQPTAFNQAMSGRLITALVNNGYVVNKTPAAALKVDIDTQVVAFSGRRPQYSFAGERSALAAGAWVLTGVQHSIAGLATAAVVADDAYTWFRSEFASGATPKTEIVVTVSVSDEHRYYARYTSVYYVTDDDRLLYEVAPPKDSPQITKLFTVKGG